MFQVLISHVWLMAPLLDSANIDYFHHCRKFCWTKVIYRYSHFERVLCNCLMKI